jgi:hypothetical protein
VAKLSLILILAVLAAAVQCPAACTPAVDVMPHCHHHKQAPKQACSNELVASNPAQAWAVTPGVVDERLQVEPKLRTAELGAVPLLFEWPPPGRSFSILRI